MWEETMQPGLKTGKFLPCTSLTQTVNIHQNIRK